MPPLNENGFRQGHVLPPAQLISTCNAVNSDIVLLVLADNHYLIRLLEFISVNIGNHRGPSTLPLTSKDTEKPKLS
jgi:hypothetical protein